MQHIVLLGVARPRQGILLVVGARIPQPLTFSDLYTVREGQEEVTFTQ